MIRSRVSRAWPLGAAAVLAWAALASGASADEAQPFKFRQLPFMIGWKADEAAQAFLAEHFKPGAPLDAAMRAAAAAGAPCKRPRDAGDPIVCTYTYMNQRPTGDLDEDGWRIEITPTPDGKVQSAEVGRIRAGL